tara:strand:+ start:285 stop:755 length:471 start_codon:yes stop_codon:yes gene_type:complete
MNESEQRKFDTNQQHEAFMKAGGYTKDEDGKWSKKVNVKVIKPERKERIVEVEVSKVEEPPMVLNIEEEFRDFVREAGISEEKKEWDARFKHLEKLACSLMKLVYHDQVFDKEEIDSYYTASKAAILLSVLSGCPPDFAIDITKELVEGVLEDQNV